MSLSAYSYFARKAHCAPRCCIFPLYLYSCSFLANNRL